MTDSTTFAWALTCLFLVHFIAFLILSLHRRTWQYASTLVTFALLVILNTCKATAVGSSGFHTTLRVLALLSLSVSIGVWYQRRRSSRKEPHTE